MKIEKILAGIRQPKQEKVASETPAAAAPVKAASESPLNSALTAALETSKVASEKTSPVADVMKVAAELESAEKEAEVKHAQVMGRAFADAAISRISEWQDKSAALAPVKVAHEDEEFAKFASENQELVRQAALMGYEVSRAGLEKMAEDAYVQGYNDTVVAIHKTAAVEFMKAAQLAGAILDARDAQ